MMKDETTDPLALDPEDGTLCADCKAPRNAIHSPMCSVRAGAKPGRIATPTVTETLRTLAHVVGRCSERLPPEHRMTLIDAFRAHDEAISRAQDAEKARYPLHVVTADPSIEARASREVPAEPPLTPAEEVLADLLAIDVHGPANFGDAVIEVMVRHDWRGGRRPNERAAALLRRAGKRP